jgi:hypothetical protein
MPKNEYELYLGETIYYCDHLNISQCKHPYIYVKPIHNHERMWAVDCWIVDAHDNVNPDYNISPVPVNTYNIFKEVERLRKENT